MSKTNKKKNPGNIIFPGFDIFVEIVSPETSDYRLENCGALRAALRPGFLRSFIRGSRVKNPAAFRTGL